MLGAVVTGWRWSQGSVVRIRRWGHMALGCVPLVSITSSDQCYISMNPSLPSFFSSLIRPGKNNRKKRLMDLRVNSLFFTWYSKTETGAAGFVSQARILWFRLNCIWMSNSASLVTFQRTALQSFLLPTLKPWATVPWWWLHHNYGGHLLPPSLNPMPIHLWVNVWVPWVRMVFFIFFNHISIKIEDILHVSWSL